MGEVPVVQGLRDGGGDEERRAARAVVGSCTRFCSSPAAAIRLSVRSNRLEVFQQPDVAIPGLGAECHIASVG